MKNQISQHALLSLTIWCQYIWNLLFSVHTQDLQNLSVSEEQQEGVSQVSVVHFFLSENMFIIYLQHVIILNTSLVIYLCVYHSTSVGFGGGLGYKWRRERKKEKLLAMLSTVWALGV